MILPVASSTVTLVGSRTVASAGKLAFCFSSSVVAVVNLVPAGAVTGLPSLSVNVGAATTASSPTVPLTGL